MESIKIKITENDRSNEETLSIGPDHPFFEEVKDMVETVSKNETIAKKVKEFFDWYEEIFKIAMLEFNGTCQETSQLIDDFEKELESKKNSKEDCSFRVNSFSMSLIKLQECYSSHLSVAHPFINMAFRYSFEGKKLPKFFKDIALILEGTNKRVEHWEKILDRNSEKK